MQFDWAITLQFRQIVDRVVFRPAGAGGAEVEAEYLLDPTQRTAGNQGNRRLDLLVNRSLPHREGDDIGCAARLTATEILRCLPIQ